MVDETSYEIQIRGGVWQVTYAEKAGTLKFSFEMGMPRDILYFPTETVWQTKAPVWALNRREEILARISAAFGGGGCEVVEVEDF